ncbi:MAG TPA: T9SS type A sorting domain-containing protein [Flavobacteriales bacterium]
MRTLRPSLLAAFGLLCFGTLPAQFGTFDPSFNGTGYVIQPVNNMDGVQRIVVQPDQKIITLGMSWDATYTARAYAFRYLPDGTLDTDFATDGVFMHELDNEALLYSAVVKADGKILLVGATTDYQKYRILLIQLNSDGTLDPDFGIGGVVARLVSPAGANAEDMAFDVALDSEGRILVCGSSHDENYVRRPVVVRFTATGDLDTTFGDQGVASIPVMAVGSSAFKAFQLQPDGKIVAAGFFGETELWYTLLLVRFNADGTLDGTFSDDGIVKHNHGNVDDEAYDLELTADGSIIVAGKTVTVDYNYSALLMKFTSTGEVDDTFGDNGAVEEDLDQFDYAWELELQPDGRIIMAGTSGEGPPNGFDMAVWKYASDGTRDTDFGNNGLAMPGVPDRYAMIYGLALQADGQVLVGGQARTENNENHFLLARLKNDLSNGIADTQELGSALVMPNPAASGNTIVVRTAGAISADARILLHTSDGRLVQTYRATQYANGIDRIQLQLPDALSPGAYLLTIQQGGTRSAASILVE